MLSVWVLSCYSNSLILSVIWVCICIGDVRVDERRIDAVKIGLDASTTCIWPASCTQQDRGTQGQPSAISIYLISYLIDNLLQSCASAKRKKPIRTSVTGASCRPFGPSCLLCCTLTTWPLSTSAPFAKLYFPTLSWHRERLFGQVSMPALRAILAISFPIISM